MSRYPVFDQPVTRDRRHWVRMSSLHLGWRLDRQDSILWLDC